MLAVAVSPWPVAPWLIAQPRGWGPPGLLSIGPATSRNGPAHRHPQSVTRKLGPHDLELAGLALRSPRLGTRAAPRDRRAPRRGELPCAARVDDETRLDERVERAPVEPLPRPPLPDQDLVGQSVGVEGVAPREALEQGFLGDAGGCQRLLLSPGFAPETSVPPEEVRDGGLNRPAHHLPGRATPAGKSAHAAPRPRTPRVCYVGPYLTAGGRGVNEPTAQAESSRVTPHYVVEVLGRPYREHGRWWLRVRANCHGHTGENLLGFEDREDALAVGYGCSFLA